MNILFPIAGYGTRFKEKGYSDPKPFIKIKNKYIIEYALSSLNLDGNYFIITRSLEKKYKDILYEISKLYNLNIKIFDLDRSTSGQAETCYLICDKINLSEKLIITNCDQYTPWDSKKFTNFLQNNNFDGVVTTYKHYDIEINKPGRYSYIKINNDGIATELKEKFAISEHALNGIFYWKCGELFKYSTELLLKDNIKEETYVSLTYNKLIQNGYKITNYYMNQEEFVSLGSPEEIERSIHLL